MSKKKQKKSDKENRTLECIVFITAILNLIQAVTDLIKALFEQENKGKGAKAPSTFAFKINVYCENVKW